jgi:hypothetical protein
MDLPASFSCTIPSLPVFTDSSSFSSQFASVDRAGVDGRSLQEVCLESEGVSSVCIGRQPDLP